LSGSLTPAWTSFARKSRSVSTSVSAHGKMSLVFVSLDNLCVFHFYDFVYRITCHLSYTNLVRSLMYLIEMLMKAPSEAEDVAENRHLRTWLIVSVRNLLNNSPLLLHNTCYNRC
jgi:hypothetical protein